MRRLVLMMLMLMLLMMNLQAQDRNYMGGDYDLYEKKLTGYTIEELEEERTLLVTRRKEYSSLSNSGIEGGTKKGMIKHTDKLIEIIDKQITAQRSAQQVANMNAMATGYAMAQSAYNKGAGNDIMHEEAYLSREKHLSGVETGNAKIDKTGAGTSGRKDRSSMLQTVQWNNAASGQSSLSDKETKANKSKPKSDMTKDKGDNMTTITLPFKIR